MPNYKETTAPGTAWTRCNAITISNRIEGSKMFALEPTPTAHFYEERVVSVEGAGNVCADIGRISKPFNPTDTITLLDPATGEATGETVTHGALYGILFSLYMQTAVERDTINPP
jgi:hypothetical protein